MKKSFKEWLMTPASYFDVFLLAVFTALITANPYFMHGKINIFETGLYLPGIQSILDGEVPFRDFFHLRGPFELYMPAFLMKLFGEHLSVLYSYFYFGNVLCLVLCVLIAKELFKTRAVLYLMTPVLIGRAWPRVVFTYWGGMRYAFGLLAVWFIIKYFKKKKLGWIFGAGVASALGGFTSVEMGAYPFLGIIAAMIFSKIAGLYDMKTIFKALGVYISGLCVIAVPYGTYLYLQGALIPYIDGVLTIVLHMQEVIDPHLVSVYPRNFPEAFVAMTNPGHTNFKHMTPSYLYIFILVYLVRQLKKKTCSSLDVAIVCLGVYGFIMYNTGFRGIWAAQFEMALQPEKILMFFLLECFLLYSIKRKEILKGNHVQPPLSWLNRDRWKIYCFNAFAVILICSSIGYSMRRYDRRFFAFKYARDKVLGRDTGKLKPSANEGSRRLNIARAQGIIVPVEQANELEQAVTFIEDHVKEDEEIFTYPDLGTYNFLAGRRGFGKYPFATFTWFNPRWHEEFMGSLRSQRPRYILLKKEISQDWKDVYLALEPNRQKFKDVMDVISSDYEIESETELSYIYKLK